MFLDPTLSKIVRTRFLQWFFTLTKHNDIDLSVTFSFSFYADKYVQSNL